MNLRARVRRFVNERDSAFSLRQRVDMWPALLDRRLGRERSWSQFGEDEILCKELQGLMHSGFYVDIGANHPARLSNTWRLHCRGMRGVTVEPNRVLFSLHERFRAEDVHLCAGAGERDGALNFYRMVPHPMSTFSAEQCEKNLAEGCRLLSRSLVPVLSVKTILESCSFQDRPIFALLSVDTESLDEAVLRGNDWDRFRPILIEVESFDHGGAIRDLLIEKGYELLTSTGHNDIYRLTQNA